MRFLVAACPACRRAQAIEARFERPKCVGCRGTLVLRDLKVFYRGDSESEARAVVMKVGAQLHGMDAAEFARVMASLTPEPKVTVEDVVRALEARGEFSGEDFASEMQRLGAPGEPMQVLQGLRADNRIFEPREGRFRIV